MRYVRWVGFVSSLVFVGVLMAPLPSEADNTKVTFQVDSGAVATLLDVASGANSTCTVPSGYTRCYEIPTTGGPYTGNNSRSYKITGYDGNAIPVARPRLLVTDTGGLDNLTFTTVEFKPVATTWGTLSANCGACTPLTSTSYGEQHTLKVEITHTFGLAANIKTASPPTDATKYKFALRASGMFKGSQTGSTTVANQTASGDFVKFEGVGKFGTGSTTTPLLSPFPTGASACNTSNSRANPLDVNYCPLRRTMAGTSAPTSSFSTNPALEQVNVTNNPYPSYVCDSNGTDCRPTVILTLTATVYGPDSWVLSSSGDAAGGSCNLVPPGPPVSTPAVPCQSQGKGKNNTAAAAAQYFDGLDAIDAPLFAAEQAQSTPACEGTGCPTNGTFNGYEYLVINTSNGINWYAARSEAQALGEGWDLADIRSQAEQDFIQTLLPPNPRGIPGTHDYWIAGKQQVESAEPGGNWRWANTGEVFYNEVPIGYANWGTESPGPYQGPDNEPNDLGNENRVTLDNRYGWGWNDLNENVGTKGFVAKRPIGD